jgi:hypothetical protein
MESKYQNGKIYKIVCNDTGKIYIGSTTKSLNTRLINHKTGYKRYLQGKTRYNTSYQIIENNNYHIELILDYPCSCKKELETMEAKYVRELDCVNKKIPCRSIEEKKEYVTEYGKQYREQNKEQLREYDKQYREQNKDKRKEYDKQYNEQNKEQKKQYREQNKEQLREQKKQYREQNKDKIREQRKQYREQNKDKIREYHKQYYERMKQNKISI